MKILVSAHRMKLKLFGKNTLIYSTGNLALRGVAFFLIPLYTHNLSVKEYGLLATSLVTIQFFLVAMGLGMRNTLLRFTSEYEKKKKISYLIGNTTIINFLGGFFVTGTSLFFFRSIFSTVLHVPNPSGFVVLICAAAFAQSLYLHYITYFTARNQASRFLTFSLIAALLLILMILFFLLKLQWGVKGVLYAHIFTYGLMLLFASGVVLMKTGFAISLPIARELWVFGFPLVFSMSGLIFIATSSTYLLSYFSGLESVAIFRLGYKLAQILGVVLILPFQMAFQPFVFANLDHPEIRRRMSQLFTYFLFALAFFSFAIQVISKSIFPILAPESYSSAFWVIFLTLPAMTLYGVTVFGECLLNVKKKTKLYGVIVSLCAIVNFAFNLILIPLFDWRGLAASLIVTYGIMTVATLFFGLSGYPLRLEWRRIGMAGGIFVLFQGVVLASMAFGDGFFYFSASVTTGAILLVIYCGNFITEIEKDYLRRLFLHLHPRVIR